MTRVARALGFAFLIAISLAGCSDLVLAQTYPSRPSRWVPGFAPAEFRALVERAIKRFAELTKIAGIQPE